MKKNFVLKTLLPVLICSCFYPCIANDLAGSQLTYTHLGGTNYHFTYVLYRDCMGGLAPGFEILHANSTACSISQQFSLVPSGLGTEITNACPSAVTSCNGGAIIGIQKWIYEADVTLPGQCSDWVFSVSHCCFTYNITTALNIHGEYSYAEARLDNSSSDNTSPVFTNEPVISICQNQDFHYNNGLVDPEGDSLAYLLTPVLTASNQSVAYLPGYTSQQPVTSSPQLTFDQVTGDLFIHPTAIETGVLTYTVLEYRNGSLIGSTARTILLNIIPCTNQPPVLSGINGTIDSTAYALPGTMICFDIFSDDPDAGQLLSLSWNNGIPGATFTTAGVPHPTGTFCWQTTMGDLRTLPYDFTARIADDNCPYLGVGIYSYHIYVTLDSSLVGIATNDLNLDYDISISPNPSSGVFELLSQEKISQINVFDSFGKLILNTREIRIDISNQAEGIYFSEIKFDDGRIIWQRLLKK